MRKIANHIADREELNQILEDYQTTMEEVNQEMSNIQQNQDNASSSTTKTFNFANIIPVYPVEVYSNISAITNFWDGMVEADRTAKSQFSDSENSTRALKGVLNEFLSAIGKNGGKVNSLDIQALQHMMFADKTMLDYLNDGLEAGNKLTSAEKDLLYYYLQNEFFSEKEHEHMDRLSDGIANDPEAMLDHINNNVLESEGALNEEIAMIELYLYSGNIRPEDLNTSNDDRLRLNSYLQTLKNYRTAIKEVKDPMKWDRNDDDPLLARIENFSYSKQGDKDNEAISGVSESVITIYLYDEPEDGMSREEFLKSENPLAVRVNESKTQYFFGSDAGTDFVQQNKLNDEDELDTYTGEFIGTELLGLALTGPYATIFGTIQTIGGYQGGKNEIEQRLTAAEIQQTANDFNLEIVVNNRYVPGHGEGMEVELHPTDATYTMLDRWEAVHQADPSIPYPEEEINNQDWDALNDYMYGDGNKANMKMDDETLEIYEYIMTGEEYEDNPVVEEAIKGNH